LEIKQFEQLFLNRLLDKYEKSSLYKGTNKVNVNISLPYDKKNIPEYYDENDIHSFEAIHQASIEMEYKGFIKIVWEDSVRKNRIKKIILTLKNIDEIYKYIDRTPKIELEEATKSCLKKYLGRNSYLDLFVNEQLDLLRKNKLTKKYLNLENQEEIVDLLNGINGLLMLEDEISLRQFSIKIYNDSKKFEKLLPKVHKIIINYWDNMDDLNQDEVFGRFNLTRNPGYVYIKGNGVINIGNSYIDLKSIPGGIAISSTAIEAIQPNLADAKYVVTIENLTSFVSYPKQDAFVIYLGGYMNRNRKAFLKNVYKLNPGKTYYHFGDIDLGGFQILEHMKRETAIPFIPLYMNVSNLLKYSQYLKPITDSYRILLQKAKLKDEMKVYENIFDTILDLGGTLEQEIIDQIEECL